MNRALRNSTNVTHALPEKHVTRASMKAAAGDQPGIVTRRGTLADQRNIITSKGTKAAQQEISKKGDAKKVVQAAAVLKKVEKEATKNAIEIKDKAKQSFTQSRFDAVVLHCEQFKDDVENYIFCIEKHFGVSPNFLEEQQVTPKMRAILIDWLVQVHTRFHLLPETLFLCVNILDRYLALGIATKEVLQLVGVACLSAASKYEEIFPPDVSDYVYVTENSLKKPEIIHMEYKILAALNCDLGRPTVIQFLRRLSTFFNPTVHVMAKYVSENIIISYEVCHLNPSMVAVLSVWFAAVLNNCQFAAAIYSKARVTRNAVHELAPKVATHLLEMQRSTRLFGVRDKYNNSKHAHVSHFAEEQISMLTYIAGQAAAPIPSLP